MDLFGRDAIGIHPRILKCSHLGCRGSEEGCRRAGTEAEAGFGEFRGGDGRWFR